MIEIVLFGIFMGFAMPTMAQDFNQPFTARAGYEEMRITWIPVDDVQRACATAYHKKPWTTGVVACAHLSGSVCTVYTQRKLDLAILGHEIRHCYEGAWHE